MIEGYKLKLNNFIPKHGEKIHLIELTDIQFHTTTKRTSNVGKVLSKSMKTMKPGRLYSSEAKIDRVGDGNGFKMNILDFAISNSPELAKEVQQKQSEGYRVVIKIPHSIPIKLGDDSVEFYEGKNGKRLARGINKNN